MGTANNRIAHKHFRLNVAKIKHAQKLMQAETETETETRARQLGARGLSPG